MAIITIGSDRAHHLQDPGRNRPASDEQQEHERSDAQVEFSERTIPKTEPVIKEGRDNPGTPPDMGCGRGRGWAKPASHVRARPDRDAGLQTSADGTIPGAGAPDPRGTATETDCVAGLVGLELGNACASHVFEMS
jgi:hypothetical protein